jgi:hypothetical protein
MTPSRPSLRTASRTAIQTQMKLTEPQKKQFLNVVYGHTNPIRPHEAAIVSSILRIHTGEHFWRFQKHVYCPGCRRELTTLDYFLSGLKHHTVDFILKQICPDYEQHGTCDHEADAINVDKIDIVPHGIQIDCIACGGVYESLLYDLYVHPGCKGYVIRLSQAKYDAILKEAGLGL